LQSVPAAQPGSSEAAAQVPFVGEPPLTYGVRAPAPFVTPPGRHLARSRPRVATWLAVGVALGVALLAATTVLLWPSGGPGRAPRQPMPRVAADHPVSAPAPSSAPAPQPSFDARAVLATLDGARARAYAQRDPALLSEVYASARLLQRDRAQLRALVPTGCALRGLHSRFRSIRVVERTAQAVSVQARVLVAASRLTCAGMSSARVPAGTPAALRMTLVRRGGRYLIAAEHRARS
jgi:hypothetical protein